MTTYRRTHSEELPQMSLGSLLACTAGGAALMFLFDPNRGRRRRKLIWDKAMAAGRKLADAADKTARDVTHRSQGLFAEARGIFRHDHADDVVLAARVRSKLGRFVSHPRAIQVQAHNGRVTLRGPILIDEVDELISAVSRTAGVSGVESRLEIYEHPGDIPALQGGRRRPGERLEWMQENWSPAGRFVAGLSGGALCGWGIWRGGIVGSAATVGGGALLVRAATNLPARDLIGVGGAEAIEIHKTINIEADLDYVYAFWRAYENFPLFMHNVREVKELPQGRSQWVIAGPAGAPVEFDAELVRVIPRRLIAWRSVGGGDGVAHGGRAVLPKRGRLDADRHPHELLPAGRRGRTCAGDAVLGGSEDGDGWRPGADEDDDRDRTVAARCCPAGGDGNVTRKTCPLKRTLPVVQMRIFLADQVAV